MTKPFFSGRISHDLNKKATAYCTEHGISKTKLLELALSDFISEDKSQDQQAAPNQVVLNCLDKLIENQAFLAKVIKNAVNLSPSEKNKLRAVISEYQALSE